MTTRIDVHCVWLTRVRACVSSSLSSDAAYDRLGRLYHQLGGAVSVYTLDQRGVGQSAPLTCAGSDLSSTVQLTECLESLHEQLRGNVAAFSLTSAAFDLVTLISQTQSGADVVVYGLGFGSLVVERLLHFGVAAIKGYVLDGPTTTSGAALSVFPFASNVDAEFGRVGDRFLALCDTSALCTAQFPIIAAGGGNLSVAGTLRDILARAPDSSPCMSLWSDREAGQTEPASFRIRQALATLLQNATERALIPAVVYRLYRCSVADQQALQRLARHVQTRVQELARHSELAFELLTFSELWELDTPTLSVLETRVRGSLISPSRALHQLRRYCVFAGDTTSTACSGLNDLIRNRSAAPVRFTYARDRYWNVSATVPSSASVLIMSRGLDGSSPPERAQRLADAMIGTAKAVVAFPAGTHSSASALSSSRGDSECVLDILSAYVLNWGDLDALKTSCLANEPTTPDFRITEAVSLQVWGLADAYADTTPPSPGPAADPKNDSSSSGGSALCGECASLERSLKLYRAAFFVALSVVVAAVLVGAVMLWRWWRRTQLQDEEKQLRRMRGEEPDNLELLRQIYLSSPEGWDANATAAGLGFGGLADAKAERSKSSRSDAGAEKSFSLTWDHSDERPSTTSTWVFRASHLQL